ncbi:MAG: glycosyltransferase [Candidatus Omnitrophica bacterium]|nr:glycosyltransferase [Candidatus Omnitrophota bacterium]
MDLSKLNILLSGQLITSRTETIEEYLKDRVNTLGVIGLVSVFAPENVSRCSLYEESELEDQFKIPSILIKKRNLFTQFLLIPAFILYFISIISASFRFRKTFDIFIGVACFSTFVGIFLKKIGRVKRLIYYCIDYYPYPKKFCFNTVAVWAFRLIDKFCVKNADIVWHISTRIAEARYRFEGMNPDSYRHIVVPLCYSSKLLRKVPFEEIERWTIGFVGTLSSNQGLQLLIKAMPEVLRQLPEVRVKIIGRGPYEPELRSFVRKEGIENTFEFLGFIKDENKVLDILSRCAIGIAPWISSEDDNILYADPGKPKLYAFCGLPIIITKGAVSIAGEIQKKKAGLSISYDGGELVQTVVMLLGNDEMLKSYRNNALDFASNYTSEHIFDRAFYETLNNIQYN